MSLSVSSPTPPVVAQNPPSPAKGEPITFTHDGHEYTVTYEADGGAIVSRDDGITKHLNAEQAALLQGLPTTEPLFGAAPDAPQASFDGMPLGTLFDDPPASSAPTPLW